MSTPPFDLVVFGATSFVGQIICRYLVEQYGVGESVHWAIAGRSAAKLETLRTSLGQSTLPILMADSQSVEALTTMCNQTNVVLSTVGPYASYGEPLVRVCAETGTDYCDLTGEVHWIKRMIDKYDDLARQTGARLVPCCGYDSIPSDLGVYFLQQQAKQRFGQYCSTVQMRVKAAKGGVSGGTVASLLNLVKEASADASLRKQLTDPYLLTPATNDKRPRQTFISSATYDKLAEAWIAPFVMASVNERVVQRSNALLHYHDQFRYNEAVLAGKGPLGFVGAMAITAATGGFVLATAVGPLRQVISRFLPQPGEGPSAEAQQKGYFVHEVYGQTDAGQTLTVRITGDRDPGYGSTAKMVVQAGLCLAQDVPKTNASGGFYTPAALLNNYLLDRLQRFSGLTFSVLE